MDFEQDNMARKSTGEIGTTRITSGPEGNISELIITHLPTNKEELEQFFCERFLTTFDYIRPLGSAITITNPRQMDTSDLDYRIDSQVADYIELAEANPRSEVFGRETFRTGKFNTYDYARWIYMRLIRKKFLKYGQDQSSRVILVIYITYWQFLPSQRVFDCIRAMIEHQGCTFSAIFFFSTDGVDFRNIETIHPFPNIVRRKPADYKGFWVTNLPPGQSSWSVDMKEIPSIISE